jgi:cyclohexanecarboxylate-CoA ligase
VLTDAARRAPGDLVVDPSVALRLDGTALEDRVARVARGLRARGVRRRDVVAWQAPNWHEVVVLYRACWRLGAVAAPIHHQAGTADVEQMLAAVEPKLFLERDGLREEVRALADHAPHPGAHARPSDLAAALFTSGSSGSPKAALHTHRGLAYKARVMIAAHGLTTADAILMPAPLAHVSGLLNAVQVSGAAGMKAVLMDRWEPELALELIERERITFMIGPPTFFVALMGAPGFSPERVATLRLVSSGGAGVTPAFVEEASSLLDCRVKRTYGSTEAPTVTTSTATDSVERSRETDGHPTGAVELRVSDAGELWLRGPELFVGYSDAELTRASVSRGWFRTGDLATVDADGWLTIVGRIKDIIIRGGENIAAAEVERILEAHPDVRHAVAVGYPDDRLGERVCAFVVASRPFDLDACRRWFEARGVARFKTPERVVQLDELPVLAAGKPDRAGLQRRASGVG